MNTFQSLMPIEKELTKAFFGNDVEGRITWQPLVTVYESDESFRIELELPGLSKEDIKVRYEDELLVVEGERKAPQTAEGVKTWRNERAYGKFARTFRLVKDVDSDSIQAQMSQGVLTLILAKSAKCKARCIEITGG